MMTRTLTIPAAVLLVLCVLLALHGPVEQPAAYHDFADSRPWHGVANAFDVLSNLFFLVPAAYGLSCMARARGLRALDEVRFGYGLFFVSLALTAAGSAFYHLAPDNTRLMWDRLPIALACAAIVAILAREHLQARRCTHGLLIAFAVGSVAWWGLTGDLRPYLLLQLAPLVLAPLVLWLAGAGRAQKLAFGSAAGLYMLAKLCELADGRIFAATGISGHTLKHLLAAGAAMVLAHYFRRLTVEHHQ
jgi:hypothetical protein